MKIYAVTKGEYSDYHICALTTSAEKAEHLQKLFNEKYDEAKIETYEDGEGYEFNLYWYVKEGKSPELLEYTGAEEVTVEGDYNNIYSAFLYAPDKGHAAKKAYDMIAEYKARKANIC